jgi:hypothetical protein
MIVTVVVSTASLFHLEWDNVRQVQHLGTIYLHRKLLHRFSVHDGDELSVLLVVAVVLERRVQQEPRELDLNVFVREFPPLGFMRSVIMLWLFDHLDCRLELKLRISFAALPRFWTA